MVIMQPGLHCHNILPPPPSLPLSRLYSLDALQISDQASLTARVADSRHVTSSFVLLPRVSLLIFFSTLSFPGRRRSTAKTARRSIGLAGKRSTRPSKQKAGYSPRGTATPQQARPPWARGKPSPPLSPPPPPLSPPRPEFFRTFASTRPPCKAFTPPHPPAP